MEAVGGNHHHSTFVSESERILVVISSVASLIVCSLLLTTWKSFSAPNYLSRQLITYLGFSGLGTSLGFLMSILVNYGGVSKIYHLEFCHLQAFLIQYFNLASYLWTACFAYHLYQIIVKSNESPEKYLWKYRMISWGIPGIFLLYLTLRELSGQAGFGYADRQWCWIASTSMRDSSNNWDGEGALRQFLLFYLPVCLVFFFDVAIYYRIVHSLVNDPMASRFKKKAGLYISVFIISIIWGVINRIIQACSAKHAPSITLSILQCIFDPLQPLLHALVYGSNKASIDACRERICPAWFYASIPSSDEEAEEIKCSSRYKSIHRASEGMYDDLDECLLFFTEQKTSTRKISSTLSTAGSQY